MQVEVKKLGKPGPGGIKKPFHQGWKGLITL